MLSGLLLPFPEIGSLWQAAAMSFPPLCCCCAILYVKTGICTTVVLPLPAQKPLTGIYFAVQPFVGCGTSERKRDRNGFLDETRLI